MASCFDGLFSLKFCCRLAGHVRICCPVLVSFCMLEFLVLFPAFFFLLSCSFVASIVAVLYQIVLLGMDLLWSMDMIA